MRKIISILLLTSFMSLNVTPVLALENNNVSGATPKQFKSMVKKNKKTSDDYKFAYVNMNWWDNFNDDVLTSYIQKAILNNYDLKMASLNVQEYYQNVKIQFANELPQAGVGFSPAYVKGINTSSADWSFIAPALINYEVDIFLKNRDKTKSVKKLYEGSKLDERAAYISIASAVGTTYLNIVKLEKQLNFNNK